MSKYLDHSGLSYLWSKIKETILTPLTEHLATPHAPANAEENVIVSVKKNGSAVAPVNKIVDISIPTKLSELTQDVDYATPSEVSAAVSGAGHITVTVVDSLPAASAADSNTIYFKRKPSGETGDMYDEYKLVNGAYELIGSAQADLSPYATIASVDKATADQITAIFNTKVSSAEKYVGAENLATFWALVSPLITANTQSATDLASRVELLELILTSDVNANPFYVTFATLDGVSAEGIWNEPDARIDF